MKQDPDDSTAYHVQVNLEKDVPHNFGFGFHFDSQEAASILLGLGINEQKLTGVKFNVATRLSYNPWATVQLSFVPRRFPRFNLSYTFKKTEANIMDNGSSFANVYFLTQKAKAYFSEYHSRFLSTEVGLNFEHYRYRHFMGSDTLYVDNSGVNPLRSSYLGLYAKVDFDNTNRSCFPTKGLDFTVDAGWKFHNFMDNQEFTTFADVMLQFASYIPAFDSRLVIVPQVYSRFLIGDNYYTSYETLAGGVMPGRYVDHQLPFIGVIRPEVMYNSLVILRSDFRVNVYGKHYVTAMVNYARESADIGNFFRKGRVIDDPGNYNYGYMSAYNWWGAALRYSYDLPIGPVDVDITWSNLTREWEPMSASDTIFNRIAWLCSRREYCSRGVLDLLRRKGVTGRDADEILGRLRAGRYVDDGRYARAFARDKALLSGWGPRKIACALSSKGIPPEMVKRL